MFNGVKASEIIGLDTWENTQNITNMSYMFYGCKNITNLEPIENWDVSSLTYTHYMFDGCSNLRSLDLSKWTTGALINTQEMFDGCVLLETLDLRGFNMENIEELS